MAMTKKTSPYRTKSAWHRAAAGNDQKRRWQVCELENGVIKNDADIYDNLTLAEAEQIVGHVDQE